MSIAYDAAEPAGGVDELARREPTASAAEFSPSPRPRLGDRPARPAVAALLKERGLVAQTLAGNGVAARDVPDQLQEVLLAAWEAIRAGRFRPADRSRRALSSWVRGIAWHVGAHHAERAHVRREVPSGDTRELLSEVAGPGDLHRQVEAREALPALAIAIEQHEDRGLLLVVVEGGRLRDYARAEGIPVSSAYRRLSRARRELAARLAGGDL